MARKNQKMQNLRGSTRGGLETFQATGSGLTLGEIAVVLSTANLAILGEDNNLHYFIDSATTDTAVNTEISASKDVTKKADKAAGAEDGNFAALHADGNIGDSGYKAADFALSGTASQAKTDLIGKGISTSASSTVEGAKLYADKEVSDLTTEIEAKVAEVKTYADTKITGDIDTRITNSGLEVEDEGKGKLHTHSNKDVLDTITSGAGNTNSVDVWDTKQENVIDVIKQDNKAVEVKDRVANVVLSGLVDTVTGESLMSDAERTLLTGIQSGAQVNDQYKIESVAVPEVSAKTVDRIYALYKQEKGQGDFIRQFNDSIVIPKERHAKSGSTIVVDDEHPVAGLANGTYIKIIIENDEDNPVYINTATLAAVYTEGDGIHITDDTKGVISVVGSTHDATHNVDVTATADGLKMQTAFDDDYAKKATKIGDNVTLASNVTSKALTAELNTVSDTNSGLMSAEQATRLENIEAGAQVNVLNDFVLGVVADGNVAKTECGAKISQVDANQKITLDLSYLVVDGGQWT